MATISLMATGCLHQRASEGLGDSNDAERTSASGADRQPNLFHILYPYHRVVGGYLREPFKLRDGDGPEAP